MSGSLDCVCACVCVHVCVWGCNVCVCKCMSAYNIFFFHIISCIADEHTLMAEIFTGCNFCKSTDLRLFRFLVL